MKTSMNINSIHAFNDIINELPKRRGAVLAIIYEYRDAGITSFNIAEILKLRINQVTGRINELMKMQLIRVKNVENFHGKSRNRYTLRLASDPLNVFPDDLQARVENFTVEMYSDSAIDMISKNRIRELILKYELLKP
jgi:predicted ArsR family transcriptional regulator